MPTLTNLEVHGEFRERPRMFSMPLPEGHLVLELLVVEDASEEDYPGYYRVYAFPADRKADASLWREIEAMEPVGRIPASDIEWEDGILRVRTMAIERFAA
jgi:hypothetical protein